MDTSLLRNQTKRRLLGPLVLASLITSLNSGEGKAQGVLPGCRLVGASLQCIPGLTTSPQNQINILKTGINADIQAEGMVEQTIEGLERFLLTGEAMEGSLLKAKLILNGNNVDIIDFHWYRNNSNDEKWQLIAEEKGSRYQLGPEDLDESIMAVLVVRTDDGAVRRVSSNTIGPIISD